MSRKVDALIGGKSGSSRGDKTEPCQICNEQIQPGQIHCNGSKAAYGCQTLRPHHGAVKWDMCWKCAADMGCSTCVPGKSDERGKAFIDDLVCKRCRVKANLPSLLNGGPIGSFALDIGPKGVTYEKIRKATPGLGDYPLEWRQAYTMRRLSIGLAADCDEESEFRELLKAFRTFHRMPKLKSKSDLRRERNEQVAELAGKEA